MNELSTQQCATLTASDTPLNQKETRQYLQQLDPQWQLNSSENGTDNEANSISHTYKFKNYYQTMAFTNVIAQIAHQQDHHPDLLISYNRCTVTFSTHSVGGLSVNDFICAAKINNAIKL